MVMFDTDDGLEMKEMTPVEIENSRSRCWILSDPSNVKNVCEDDILYPSSWRFRQFFPPMMNHKKGRKSNIEGGKHMLSEEVSLK